MRQDDLLKALGRDPGAGMEALMERYAGLVESVVRGKLRTPPFTGEDVEDCVAEVFLEFYDALPRFDPGKGSIRSWLCVIARNRAVDRVRRRYSRPELVPLEETPALAGDDSPEGEIIRREDRERLLRELRRLEPADREILFRKYYLAQPSRVIGERMGMTVSNVDTRAHRAIEKLRKRLEGTDHG